MKKTALFLCILLFNASICLSAELTNIRFSRSDEKVRIVFDFDTRVDYKTGSNTGQLLIKLPDTKTSIESINIDDPIIETVTVKKPDSSSEALSAVVDIRQKVKARIFPLENPFRIVVDLIKKATDEAIKEEPKADEIVWSRLKTITHIKDDEKIRLVLVLNNIPEYFISSTESMVRLELPYTIASRKMEDIISLDDKMAEYAQINKENDKTVLVIPLKSPAKPKITVIKASGKIILDLMRQFSDDNTSDIAGGIQYLNTKQWTKNGAVEIHTLLLDKNLVELKPVLAKSKKSEAKSDDGNIFSNFVGGITSFFSGSKQSQNAKTVWRPFTKKKTSQMAKDEKAAAAVNGTYFGPGGRPLGVLMINKKFISSPIYNRTALIKTSEGKYLISNVDIKGYIESWDGTKLAFDGFNAPILHNEIMVYTPEFQQTYPEQMGTDIVVSGAKVTDIRSGNSKVPDDGYVISGHGEAGLALRERFKFGDVVEIKYDMKPNIANVTDIVGGGPRLIKNGKIYITGDKENFRSDILDGRAARTAIGILNNGNIIIVAVNGRSRVKDSSKTNPKSIGMTLEELADFLKEHGAVDALNLDGGGSTTMVVSGEVVNNPADGVEKNIASAIVVKLKAGEISSTSN